MSLSGHICALKKAICEGECDLERVLECVLDLQWLVVLLRSEVSCPESSVSICQEREAFGRTWHSWPPPWPPSLVPFSLPGPAPWSHWLPSIGSLGLVRLMFVCNQVGKSREILMFVLKTMSKLWSYKARLYSLCWSVSKLWWHNFWLPSLCWSVSKLWWHKVQLYCLCWSVSKL